MRIGFFGGSFDPIHHGHLILAQDALERTPLDRVGFVPAAQAPLKKSGPPGAGAQHRLAMLQAAVAGRPQFFVATDEIERGGVSYTVDTIRALRETHPGDELCWIIGADQVAQLPEWRAIDEITQMAGFLCLRRPGFEPAKPAGLPKDRLQWASARQIDLSSTEIRQRAAAGRPLDFFLPESVARYIVQHSLYR